MLACSVRANERMHMACDLWKREHPEDEIICKVKCASLAEQSEKQGITELVGSWFGQVEAIVFFCAAGIAVRSIAPWMTDKRRDPAVLVMDETGIFCIPVLSGHWGRANELAQEFGRLTGALPVITTATDRENKFAVDVFARKNGLVLTDWKAAKRLSAALLEGKTAGLYSRLSMEGSIPAELVCARENSAEFSADARASDGSQRTETAAPQKGMGVVISWKKEDKGLFDETVFLIPRVIVIGIGCKRDTPLEKIEKAVESCLREQGICEEAVCAAASIDLKKEEKGLLAFCEKKKLPFWTYSAERLREVPGVFSASGFVQSVTGVDNVCERSAVAAASGRLLCAKRAYDGVTVALAVRKASVKF